MVLTISKFTSELLAATQEAWINSADSLGIPSLDYERVLAWAQSHMNYDEENSIDSFAYGVFEDNVQEALAIVDVVYSKQHGPDVGWLKMLSVSLSPAYSPAIVDAEPEKLAQVIDIYAEATSGVIDLTGTHKARVIKMYGRNDSLLKLLVALKERLRIKLPSCHTKMEGRWLVVTAP